MFISWEPPPLWYIKVNFNKSVRDRWGGASFVIRGSGLGPVAIEGSYLFKPTVLVVEFCGERAGIVYVRRILRADCLIIEEDFATVVTWI